MSIGTSNRLDLVISENIAFLAGLILFSIDL